MADGSSVCSNRGCSRWKKRNFINIKLGIYNALYLFIFLPMIYKGISPILAAVLVVAFTTVVTMCMVDGITKKSVAAMLGTIIGVVFSGAFALIFGQVTSITGYNVSDIENLVYVGEMTDIKLVNCYLQES